jgi:hypothetical protein
MRRGFLVVFTVLFLGAGVLKAAPPRNQELHNLKHLQKAERKQLKQQERATRRVMRQHPVTQQERARMKKDLKMQRHLLKTSQKEAVRNLKQEHKPLEPRSEAAKRPS